MPSQSHTNFSATFPAPRTPAKQTTCTVSPLDIYSPSSSPTSIAQLVQPQRRTKNYEKAFADLSSSYGYAGPGQMLFLPPKTQGKKSKPTKTSTLKSKSPPFSSFNMRHRPLAISVRLLEKLEEITSITRCHRVVQPSLLPHPINPKACHLDTDIWSHCRSLCDFRGPFGI